MQGLRDMGSYDDCQDLPAAHYCLAKLPPPPGVPLPGLIGTCLPINCTGADFNSSLQLFIGAGTWLNLTGAAGRCVAKVRPPVFA